MNPTDYAFSTETRVRVEINVGCVSTYFEKSNFLFVLPIISNLKKILCSDGTVLHRRVVSSIPSHLQVVPP